MAPKRKRVEESDEEEAEEFDSDESGDEQNWDELGMFTCEKAFGVKKHPLLCVTDSCFAKGDL